MNRAHQFVLILATLALSWFAMMAVHEAGHVLGAVATGGTVQRVVLHPLTISRTNWTNSLSPLSVIWAGPIFGVVAPLLAWLLASVCRVSWWYLLRFLAGFCLIANGAYLGVGSFDGVGDAGDLLRHGAEAWQLWFFGLVCLPAGFLLLHRLGSNFGLGHARGRVHVPHAYAVLGVLISLVVLMAFFGGE